MEERTTIEEYGDQPQPSTDDVKVLLVEDSKADVILINDMLSDAKTANFDVTNAIRLEEARDILSNSNFDVILLDLGLPDSRGIDTMIEVSKWHLKVPLIILTGLDDEELAVQAMRLGAQDYLIKGEINERDLIRSIRYAIERRKGIQALRESEERYSNMFHKSHAIMLLVDSETGCIVDSNRAASAFYGIPQDGLGKMSIYDLNSMHSEEIRWELRRARAHGQRRFLFRHKLADGRIRDVEVFSAPIDLDGQKLVHMIVHDITDHLLEERIRRDAYSQIEENIERFATLVDEIRNPAFVILELASRKEDDISKRIVRQAERIETMVRQLDEGWLESEKVRDLLRKSIFN